MKAFADYHPAASAVYFLAVSVIVMFCIDPVIIALSLFGAIMFYFVRNGLKGAVSHLYFLGMLIIMTLINPLFSHNGATVLFVMNNNPITLEAMLYGLSASAAIISAVYWFRSFSQIMTRDKLLYLFGKLTPKLSLVLSMALRYAALFAQQAKKIRQSQQALGLYTDGNIIDRIKGNLRVFSVMLTWSLENGIITADSMAARGYGTGKRTHFSVFRFKGSDGVLIAVTLLLFAAVCTGIGGGALNFDFYPVIRTSEPSLLSTVSFIAYGILVLLPSAIEIKEALKWKYFLSKI